MNIPVFFLGMLLFFWGLFYPRLMTKIAGVQPLQTHWEGKVIDCQAQEEGWMLTLQDHEGVTVQAKAPSESYRQALNRWLYLTRDKQGEVLIDEQAEQQAKDYRQIRNTALRSGCVLMLGGIFLIVRSLI